MRITGVLIKNAKIRHLSTNKKGYTSYGITIPKQYITNELLNTTDTYTIEVTKDSKPILK
jgi:hypothetical protein